MLLAGFKVMKEKGSWNLSPSFQNVTKARQCVARESLPESPEKARSPERPFCETMEMKLIILKTPRCWECQSHSISVRENCIQGAESVRREKAVAGSKSGAL